MTTNRTCLFPLLFLLSCAFWQCGGGDPVEQLARKALKDDQGVSATEFATIRNLIAADAGLKADYPDDAAIVRYLDGLALEMSQAKRKAIQYPARIDTGAKSADAGKLTFDFYYENSASMDGYLNGKTQFKDATQGLMTRVELQGAAVKLHYINKTVFPVANFDDFLDPASVRKFGDRGSSELNQVLKTVAESVVKQPDHIAVVISDYIYSIEGKNVSAQLDYQKNTTARSLAALPRADYAVLIVKINSDFNGIYYDMLNQKAEIREKRPVYFWIIGKRDLILELPKQYRFGEFISGYETHCVLLPEAKDNERPYYTVLGKTLLEGRYDKADRGARVVTALKNPEVSHAGVFQVGVAVDFSRCPAVEDYLTDTAQYAVRSDVGDVFKVVGVRPIQDLEVFDKEQKGTATHILVLKAMGKISKEPQTLTISLKKGMPEWIEQSSTEFDVTASGRKDKTFGLKYLVEGAMMPYGYHEESVYYSFPITIKN